MDGTVLMGIILIVVFTGIVALALWVAGSRMDKKYEKYMREERERRDEWNG